MSNNNINNVDNDMVEESHVHRMKKDAYYVASVDGPGQILTTLHLLPRNPSALIAREQAMTLMATSSSSVTRSGGRAAQHQDQPDVELYQDEAAEAVADLASMADHQN
ncbi:hypothetical protein M9H77_22532 [Catharanthus roseus]|uniref:Uncharacterized protein n=1 Tax=Catharanthus roseus TaxID=4058 RepID=A0ACC0ASU4_CATRO|nr:hypothetical protein M9H77_22532 [Catharanthus roseus]